MFVFLVALSYSQSLSHGLNLMSILNFDRKTNKQTNKCNWMKIEEQKLKELFKWTENTCKDGKKYAILVFLVEQQVELSIKNFSMETRNLNYSNNLCL